jgi:hypothetical protein
MTDYNSPRHYAVGRQIHEVQKLLARTFDYGDETHLSPTLDEAMRETEAAFFHEEFDRAEHLAKVTKALIPREAPKFKADPKGCIERWREQHKNHRRKSFIREEANASRG